MGAIERDCHSMDSSTPRYNEQQSLKRSSTNCCFLLKLLACVCCFTDQHGSLKYTKAFRGHQTDVSWLITKIGKVIPSGYIT